MRENDDSCRIRRCYMRAEGFLAQMDTSAYVWCFTLAHGSVCVLMERGAICMAACEGVEPPCKSACCV